MAIEGRVAATIVGGRTVYVNEQCERGGKISMSRVEDTRQKALGGPARVRSPDERRHFDYGNGYHGSVYLNPHELFRRPSTIWRFAQDLLDVLPASVISSTEVVAGPVTGGRCWPTPSRFFSTAAGA